ncbi:MAG: hypothetical protein ABSB19_03595 [Methylomonas sp.]|jgi:hypothetical protein
MQNINPNPAEIATAISQLFTSLPTRIGEGKNNLEWTNQLKEDIGNLGVSLGWNVCTSGFKGRFENEWLYDLIWYRNDHDNKHLAEVYLVLESEWGSPHDVKYDFEKLLLAKATFKIMVFDAYDRHIEGVFGLLEENIRIFQKHATDETYIFAGYNANTKAFDVRKF